MLHLLLMFCNYLFIYKGFNQNKAILQTICVQYNGIYNITIAL